MIKFQESKPQQDPVDDIIVCGKIIGTISTFRPESGNARYHASFKLGGQLLQGFAESKMDAVTNAIATGRHQATLLLSEIDAFTNLLSPERGGRIPCRN